MYAIILVLALIALIAPAYLKTAVLVAAAGPLIMILFGFIALGIFMFTGRRYFFFQWGGRQTRRFFRDPMMGRRPDDT